jgi:hypothetical protein
MGREGILMIAPGGAKAGGDGAVGCSGGVGRSTNGRISLAAGASRTSRRTWGTVLDVDVDDYRSPMLATLFFMMAVMALAVLPWMGMENAFHRVLHRID